MGTTRITLSYPGLKNVVTTTIEVGDEAVGWRAWLRKYGPWALGATLLAPVVWLVVRSNLRRGLTKRLGPPPPHHGSLEL